MAHNKETKMKKLTLDDLRQVFHCYDYRAYREEQLRVSRNMEPARRKRK